MAVEKLNDGGRVLTSIDETGKTTVVFLTREEARSVSAWLCDENALEVTPAKRRGGRKPKFQPIPGLTMTSPEALRQERGESSVVPGAATTTTSGRADDDMLSFDFSKAIRSDVRARLKNGEVRSGKDIAALRRFLDLTPSEFASVLGTNILVVRDWEEGRAEPGRQALALIRIAARHPKVIREGRDAGVFVRDVSVIPNRPPASPGEMILEEWLKPLGMSRTALARKLKMSRQHLDGIVRGERRVTARTARMLGRALKMTPDFWLNVQPDVDLYRSTKSSGARTRGKGAGR